MRSYECPMRSKDHDPIYISYHIRLVLPGGTITTVFPTKIKKHHFVFFRMLATYTTHPVFLEMFCLLIICEGYKFRISTTCNFLQFLPTSSLLGLKIPVPAMLPHTPHSVFFSYCKTSSFAQMRDKRHGVALCVLIFTC